MLELDTSDAPLVVVRCRGAIDDEVLERYFRAHDGLLQGSYAHAVLVDATGGAVEGFDSECILQLSQWIDQRKDRLEEYCRACAIAVGDEWLGEVANAFLGFHSIELPVRIFRSRNRASDWLQPIFRGTDVVVGHPSGPEGPEGEKPGDVYRAAASRENRETPVFWSPYG